MVAVNFFRFLCSRTYLLLFHSDDATVSTLSPDPVSNSMLFLLLELKRAEERSGMSCQQTGLSAKRQGISPRVDATPL